jgi:hypothetical protein
MREAEAKLAAEVAAWFARAAAADAEEDRAHGPDRRGDEMPAWVVNKQARLERLRAAKATLEAEAKAPPPEDGAEPGPSTGMMNSGRPQRAPDGGPPDKAQRNFTDPDSRLQPAKGSFIQGYNAQAAVDGARQIIVAQHLTARPADCPTLGPLVGAIRRNLGCNPRELSADAGYCSEANLKVLARRRIAAYIATGRDRHHQAPGRGARTVTPGSRVAAMRTKLKQGGRRSRYRLRKQIVEPVFGQIKAARGFRQFLLRGFDKVKHEWAMLCTVHNLLKLANATT